MTQPAPLLSTGQKQLQPPLGAHALFRDGLWIECQLRGFLSEKQRFLSSTPPHAVSCHASSHRIRMRRTVSVPCLRLSLADDAFHPELHHVQSAHSGNFCMAVPKNTQCRLSVGARDVLGREHQIYAKKSGQ